MTTPDTSQLQAAAEAVESVFERLQAQYGPTLDADGSVARELRKAVRRSREYRAAAFVVVVVGPVKSGKSTLVNLMAGDYVSPTHFLECTVRPSVIMAASDHASRSITVHRTSDRSRAVEQIDDILDGLADATSATAGTTSEVYSLSPDNIERHVALNLSTADADDTLVTVIRTRGGDLLQGGVLLVDMPGFDGAVAGLDDPVYRAIASRADLVVFVQSSNSALSKVGDEFLALLRSENRDVPVCLVHNVFDSASWRDAGVRQEAVATQQAFAVDEIRRRGFHIDPERSYSINLGMVTDYRSRNYVAGGDELAEAARRFAVIETELYRHVIERRTDLRLRNCLNRTRQQADIVAATLRDALDAAHRRREELAAIATAFDHLHRQTLDLPMPQRPSLGQITERVQTVYETHSHATPPAAHYTTTEARRRVERFVADCRETIQAELNAIMERAMDVEHEEVVQRWRGDIVRVAAQHGVTATFDLPPQHFGYTVRLDLPTSVDELVPGRLVADKLLHLSRHTFERMRHYLRHVCEEIVARQTPSGRTVAGYLESVVLPDFIRAEDEARAAAVASLTRVYNGTIDAAWREVMDRRQVNIDDLDRQIDDLEALQGELRSLVIPQA